jgi:DNA ligase D-like protein (predicted ligase)
MPTLVDEPPEGGGWIHELKYNGYRTQLIVEAGRARAFTRNGHDWTERYQPVVRSAAPLPCENAILDGEVIVQDEHGRCDFHGLKNAIAKEPHRLVFMAFDLLHLDGADLRRMPLEDRRTALREVLGANNPSRCLQFSADVEDGRKLFEAADAMGLEGIVSKKRTSPYQSGPSKAWLKAKCFYEEELTVIGTERGDKAPVALLAPETDHGLEYAGGAFVTLGQPERDLFWETARRLQSCKPPLPMKPRKDASWSRPEMRVRVRTLRGEEMLRHATVRAITQMGVELPA